VFNINGRDIPIVHRVIKVHERTNENHLDILTKVRHTWVKLAVKAVRCGALLLLGWHVHVPLAPAYELLLVNEGSLQIMQSIHPAAIVLYSCSCLLKRALLFVAGTPISTQLVACCACGLAG